MVGIRAQVKSKGFIRNPLFLPGFEVQPLLLAVITQVPQMPQQAKVYIFSFFLFY